MFWIRSENEREKNELAAVHFGYARSFVIREQQAYRGRPSNVPAFTVEHRLVRTL